MATTSVAVLQTIWDCKWSRPGYRVAGVQEQFQPETAWVCIRPGDRRGVTEDDCANCVNWEMGPEPSPH